MLHVTYAGGEPKPDALAGGPRNNVDAIKSDGTVVPDVLDASRFPRGVELLELRGITVGSDGRLWVVSGAQTTSQIIRFAGELVNGKHAFVDVVASGIEHRPPSSAAAYEAIVHPFAIVFPPRSSAWFVSSQDTNVVTGPLPELPTPALVPPTASYLTSTYPDGAFLPSTFVASACGNLDGAPITTTPVPLPQGLETAFEHGACEMRSDERGKLTHSVRGLAHDGALLYVADEPGNQVKAYEPSGKLAWAWPPPPQALVTIVTPVHLLHHDGHLYVGSSGTDSVVRLDLATRTSTPVATGIKTISGLARDPSGRLYVASRTHKKVYYVEPGSTTHTEYASLEDEPEFLLYVSDT